MEFQGDGNEKGVVGMSELFAQMETWFYSTLIVTKGAWLIVGLAVIGNTLRVSSLEKKLHDTRFKLALQGIIKFEDVDK